MNTVEWLKVFKNKIFEKINVETLEWGYSHFEADIEAAYEETLNEMISPKENK